MMAASTRPPESTVTIHCKTCGAPLEERDLDRTRGLARCGHCDTVVELDFERPQPAVRAPHERLPVAMPERFELEHEAGELVIRWGWFNTRHLIWFVFLVGWFGVMVNEYTGFFSPTGPSGDASSGEMLFVVLVHGGFGLVMAYVTLCGFINNTTVRARDGIVHIQHGPLPWPGSGKVEGIRQLFSKEKVHQRRRGRVSYSYELHAVTTRGMRKLVGRLEEAAQALWLEQTLEERLNIEDRPVGGELPRNG
jgi:hypothetical protein